MRRSATRSTMPAGPGRAERADQAGLALQGAAAIAAALAVAVGAIGAHGFRDAGDLRGAGLMEIAGQYLMWHALGVLALSVLRAPLRVPMALLLVSSLVFAGTLVLLALGGPLWLGAITPFGGAGLIVGWIMAAWALLRERRAA